MIYNTIWAFIDLKDGDSGLVASVVPFVGSVHLTTLDAHRLPELEREAQHIADDSGKHIQLVRFERAEVVKILRPKKQYGHSS